MIKRLNKLPDGFLNCSAEDLYTLIPESTLISLDGEKKEPLFLSVLLHGNEPTGLVVAQNILSKYQEDGLPRSILLFIGNVKAASKGLRRLDDQPDYNRIWLEGHIENESAIHLDIAELLHEMARRSLFASIDIHNNTGINPHYGCVNKLDPTFLNLARLFSRTVIYFIQPGGVQSKAFSHLCPSVTLECGKVGDEFGIQLATHFVDEVINLESIAQNNVTDQDIDLFHTLAVIKIPQSVSFSFDGSDADIEFIQGIESLNFEEIPPDTSIAKIRTGITAPILVLNEDGEDITGQLFTIKENKLVNLKTLMPAMLTLEEHIIRQDCLCYVMERYEIGMGEKASDDEKPVWTV
ncbi:MAG: peptidase M14 [Gammaproteobacteria bacterium]|jgi:succinylglutamate desuccinylase|nr:peptidase M14 [Gammaproteobacteria bacterium]